MQSSVWVQSNSYLVCVWQSLSANRAWTGRARGLRVLKILIWFLAEPEAKVPVEQMGQRMAIWPLFFAFAIHFLT